MLLEWNDECKASSTLCDNNRTTSEYVITYHVAGGGIDYKRQIPGLALLYTLNGLTANSHYEITMMIVAKESNVYSDQSQVVVGTTSE